MIDYMYMLYAVATQYPRVTLRRNCGEIVLYPSPRQRALHCDILNYTFLNIKLRKIVYCLDVVPFRPLNSNISTLSLSDMFFDNCCFKPVIHHVFLMGKSRDAWLAIGLMAGAASLSNRPPRDICIRKTWWKTGFKT